MGSCCGKMESTPPRERRAKRLAEVKRELRTEPTPKASAHVAKKAKTESYSYKYEVIDVDDENGDCFDENFNPSISLLAGQRQWNPADVVGHNANVNRHVTKKVMELLDTNCTIPFIARYRLEVTGGLSPDKLRDILDAYETVKLVQKKAENVAKLITKEKKLDLALSFALANATTLSEVEHLYAPFKSGSKRTLLERAKQLGLEESAMSILDKNSTVENANPLRFVNPEIPDLENVNKVLQGWQHVMASSVSKDKDVLDYIRKLCENRSVTICSKKSATAIKKDAAANIEGISTDSFKFENYFEFELPVKNVKPHQVLALNRGEHLKILTVKIVIPEYIKKQVLSFCQSRWPLGRRAANSQTDTLLNKAFDDAYERLLEPLICRQTRAELTKTAEKESIAVFASNLKRLLLTPPVRGHTICGIDPGFAHGCKMAVVSPTGEIQATDVLYLHGKKATFGSGEGQKLKRALEKYRCEKIALGNGTACRETEMFVSDLIKSNFFKPLNVQYCIVNESGISIYSVTKEAEAEMPNLIPNLRSAVSLARRLQDPLLEYVKVEPKHIGVGMYQHDISEKLLKNSLNEVMIECVSFVGVDLNVSSEVVLGKIAGLTSAKVKSIIAWRERNGGFRNREQLLLVKGFGPKAYEQCAGFVKILPETSQMCLRSSQKTEFAVKAKRKMKDADVPDSPNPFDMTIIHPESYEVAQRFLAVAGVDISEIGTEKAISKVKNLVLSQGLENLAENVSIQVPTMKLICDALQQPLEIDIRSAFDKPLFRRSVANLDDLQVEQILSGRVSNSTHFGAFVDIGVGQDGLVHTSNMGNSSLALGDLVQVKVLDVDKDRKRIGLSLLMKGGQPVAASATPSYSLMSDIKANVMSGNNAQSKTTFQRPDNRPSRQVCSLDKLFPGTTVDGTVKNVLDYGVFVDIGARRDGLIHKSKLCGQVLERGDRVTVKIINVDIPNNKISLAFHSR